MKILVAITSFGTGNDHYLRRLIEEYRSMPDKVDIVVLSNISKDLPPGIELQVGLPTPDPWSLPFAHKAVLASRAGEYDLFIYSEDDILITRRNIESFLQATGALHSDEIAGFIRTETDRSGRRYYPDIHDSFHWDPSSVVKRGDQTFAFLTCEHSACYLLTRAQLRRAMDSGEFLVRPSEGKYDLACTAATDPYTRCGFRKLVCVSDPDSFSVSHLSNKYLGTDYDLDERDFRRQIKALNEIAVGRRAQCQLLNTETSLPDFKFSKSYYEPSSADLLSLVSTDAGKVLIVGCGSGIMEESFVRRGAEVFGIPLDSVISVCAEERGVRTVSADFASAWQELSSLRFDHIIVANILHLDRNPLATVRECANLLSPGGRLILLSPNFSYPRLLKLRRERAFRHFHKYEQTGINLITRRILLEWLRHCGLVTPTVLGTLPKSLQKVGRLASALRPYLATDLIVTAQRRAAKTTREGALPQASTKLERRAEVPV